MAYINLPATLIRNIVGSSFSAGDLLLPMGVVNANGLWVPITLNNAGDFKVSDVANSTVKQQQVSVTNVATALPTTSLGYRKQLIIQNTSAAKMWIGSSTVTAAGALAGIELTGNSSLSLAVGPSITMYAIKVGAAAATMSILEIS